MSKAHSIGTYLSLPRSKVGQSSHPDLRAQLPSAAPHTTHSTTHTLLLPLSGRYLLRYCVVALITHSHALPKRRLCLPPSSVSSFFFRPPKLLSSLLTCTYLPLLSSSHSPSFPPSSFFATHLFSKEATFSIEYFCSRLIQLRLFNIRLSIFLNRDWIHRSLSNCLHHHLNRRPNRVRNHCRIIGPISKRFP